MLAHIVEDLQLHVCECVCVLCLLKATIIGGPNHQCSSSPTLPPPPLPTRCACAAIYLFAFVLRGALRGNVDDDSMGAFAMGGVLYVQHIGGYVCVCVRVFCEHGSVCTESALCGEHKIPILLKRNKRTYHITMHIYIHNIYILRPSDIGSGDRSDDAVSGIAYSSTAEQRRALATECLPLLARSVAATASCARPRHQRAHTHTHMHTYRSASRGVRREPHAVDCRFAEQRAQRSRVSDRVPCMCICVCVCECVFICCSQFGQSCVRPIVCVWFVGKIPMAWRINPLSDTR